MLYRHPDWKIFGRLMVPSRNRAQSYFELFYNHLGRQIEGLIPILGIKARYEEISPTAPPEPACPLLWYWLSRLTELIPLPSFLEGF